LKFLVDRCAGRRLADHLKALGHDVSFASAAGPDPGDEELLRLANRQGRILVTLDKDFGELVFARRLEHAGLVRLPDLPAEQRIAVLEMARAQHADDLEAGAIVTARGARLRVTRSSGPK
jgi:predicted nuclease of predicted toxin-antitoxin system